ncbi:MAG: hypothetical protein FWC50_06815, partial [Planctomycetaceae bacterium]|nr:hypothetical protein [Planctomycetaceae bacterium]
IADNKKSRYFVCVNNVGAAGSHESGSNFMIASINRSLRFPVAVSCILSFMRRAILKTVRNS